MRAPRLLACLTIALLLLGCGAHTTKNQVSGKKTESSKALTPMLHQFEALTRRPEVAITTPERLRVPAGFTRSDVNAFAARASDVLHRSIDQRLTRLGPDKAIDYTFARQYTETTDNYKADAVTAEHGYDWQWRGVSIFDKPPLKRAKVLRVEWKTSKAEGTLDDGTRAPYLILILQAHVLHEVADGAHVAPIVVRRSVRVTGYRPTGGRAYWPSIQIETTPYGNDACPLLDGSRLVPQHDPDVFREDLAALKTSIATDHVLSERFADHGTAKAHQNFLAKSCPTQTHG